MIDLYGTGSPNVFKVLLMLSETDLDYKFHDVRVYEGEQFQHPISTLNPNCKLPVIVDAAGPSGRPHTVFESGAILIYLAEKSGRFLPSEPAERSVTLQWLMFQMASIGPMFGQALHFDYIAPSDNTYGRHRYRTEVERLYAVVERRLKESEWIGGDQYSIADMACVPWIGRYAKTLNVDMVTRPATLAWIARIEQRAGFQRINEMGKRLYWEGIARQRASSKPALDKFFHRPPSS